MPTGETYIIPTKMDTAGVKVGVSELKGALMGLANDALPIFGIGTAAKFVGDQMVGAVRETMAYAKEVRGLSLASGTTAEESSRLIQVLDDYGVKTEDLLKATKKLTENGYAPTIDTVINLAEKYQSLTSAQERNAFINQNLGKDYEKWNFVLSQSTDTLRESNVTVADANILTDEEIAKVRDAEIALDNWGDAVAAAKTEFAIGLMPALTDTMNGLLAMGEAQGKEVKWYEWLVPAIGSLHTLYEGITGAEKDAAAAANEHAKSLNNTAAAANNAKLALQGLDKQVQEGYWHQSGGFTYQGDMRNIYGGIPNRASGGPVVAGQAYNVVELNRPEIFTPTTSGRVDPVGNQPREVVAKMDEERFVRLLVSAIQQGALSQ